MNRRIFEEYIKHYDVDINEHISFCMWRECHECSIRKYCNDIRRQENAIRYASTIIKPEDLEYIKENHPELMI